MTVYIESAFAENFLLDGLLLYLAVRCARGQVGWGRLALAAAVGGGEALLFPLLDLPAWCGFPVKVLGGLLITLIAVKRASAAGCLLTAAAFFGLTFSFGGLLTAVCSLADLSAPSQGLSMGGAPVALVFSAAGIFAAAVVFAAKKFYRYRRIGSSLFSCRVSAGRTVRCRGFADSGNGLCFRGQPVCVVSAIAALALFRGREPVGRMRVSTVNGSRDAPVFSCDVLEINGVVHRNAYLTVGEVASKDYQILLHSALVEETS